MDGIAPLEKDFAFFEVALASVASDVCKVFVGKLTEERNMTQLGWYVGWGCGHYGLRQETR
ncbi:hypothetical protein AZKH_3209 [Azoarcus sp. KH32C]|nr:hypothetical protein AZKH_3209 [Azoarcus sp. KH32C]